MLKREGWSTRARLGAAVLLSCALLTGAGVPAADAEVATTAGAEDGVSAVVIDSYYSCEPGDVWMDLNQNWSGYGSVPLTSRGICGNFTLGDLEATGADTVILDATGFESTLGREEIAALVTYANEGHTIVGVGPIFKWSVDRQNNGLAPIFGIAKQHPWRQHRIFRPLHYNKLRKHDPDAGALLHNLRTFVTGTGLCQRPSTVTWVESTLAGARYLGWSGPRRSRWQAITAYDAPTYTAIYISTWATAHSSHDDEQFLYNAAIFPAAG